MLILSKIRILVYGISVKFMPWMYRTLYGIKIGVGTTISRKATLDKGVNPKGIIIGNYVRITGGVIILAHDDCRKLKGSVKIGNNCFLGVRSIILPNVEIGNDCIIGAGSVVTKNIPPNSIVAGNPAKIIKSNIRCDHYGRLIK